MCTRKSRRTAASSSPDHLDVAPRHTMSERTVCPTIPFSGTKVLSSARCATVWCRNQNRGSGELEPRRHAGVHASSSGSAQLTNLLGSIGVRRAGLRNRGERVIDARLDVAVIRPVVPGDFRRRVGSPRRRSHSRPFWPVGRRVRRDGVTSGINAGRSPSCQLTPQPRSDAPQNGEGEGSRGRHRRATKLCLKPGQISALKSGHSGRAARYQ